MMKGNVGCEQLNTVRMCVSMTSMYFWVPEEDSMTIVSKKEVHFLHFDNSYLHLLTCVVIVHMVR